MPVDRNHAFGEGPVYGRPGVLARLLGIRGARLWRSFERRAEVGDGVLLGPSAWCVNHGPRDRVRLGRNAVCRGLLRRETFGDGRVILGDDAYVGDDVIVSCAAHVEIGEGALLAHGVQVFDNDSHPLGAAGRAADWSAVRGSGERSEIASAPVRIGAGAWVGFGAVVLKGVSIGNGAIVGACSVVTRDVPAGAIVAGNPARALDGAH